MHGNSRARPPFLPALYIAARSLYGPCSAYSNTVWGLRRPAVFPHPTVVRAQTCLQVFVDHVPSCLLLPPQIQPFSQGDVS